MTKRELSQLYYLNREIERDQQKLRELECAATATGAKITGMPRAAGTSDRVGNYAAEIEDLRSIIALNIQRCWYERNRLERFIQSVEDSETRMILSLRYINGLSWRQVARSMSPYATEDSVRMRADRFLGEK